MSEFDKFQELHKDKSPTTQLNYNRHIDPSMKFRSGWDAVISPKTQTPVIQ